MKRLPLVLCSVVALVSLGLASCSQAAPAPAPTKVPVAAPTKAPEPAKAAAAVHTTTPAAAPTRAPEPAKKVDFPLGGKTITIIVPFNAGGNSDTGVRIITPALEKELGTPVQVVNKAGAGSQVGITELAKSKPDGYTVGNISLPSGLVTYLDPERKAVYGRKDLQPLALETLEDQLVAVKADSPFTTVKDLVDAARSNPEKVTGATSGILNPGDIGMRLLQKEAGIKFGTVNFDGGAPAMTALLGGHVDFGVNSMANFTSQIKSGEIRIIGIMGKEENPFIPGVKTLEAQGYKVYAATANGFILPAGTPKEIQDLLAAALKKVILSEDTKKKMADVYMSVRYMDQAEFAAYWDQVEASVKPFVEPAKR